MKFGLWIVVYLTCIGILGLPVLGQAVITEQRLNDLRQIAQPPPLPELPSDRTTLPQDWLGVVSWNVQVGGASTSASALRAPMVRSAIEGLFGGSFQILAAQEISGPANAAALMGMLPGGAENWVNLFADTSDSLDNGFWLRNAVKPSAFSTLFVHSAVDSSGRRLVDDSRTTHPPVVVNVALGDFDFTLIVVHLTFADGETQESARELREVLTYLDSYFNQPGHDPDVVICGDFNIPTRLSGQIGNGGLSLDPIFEDDPRFRIGNRRLVATVHEPTSRGPAVQGGLPRNSYDHFIFSVDALEELVQARRVDPEILTAHPDDPEFRLTSDHFPIVALFRTSGERVRLDASSEPASSITSVVDGASFRAGITAGSWITIFGSELAPTTRIWRDNEIVDGTLPSSLDQVAVRVNGRPAAIFFISPAQLNVQAPDDNALGPVTVEVQHNGVTRAAAMAELRQAAPGLFSFDPQGRKYLAAVHLDGTFAGPDQLFGDAVVTRPVKPGEVVLLFGTGFGATVPPVSAGRVFSGAAPLKDTARVLMGGIQADVLFAGLSGAGLNQLNVRVPENIPSGDVPVIAETLGSRTQEGVFLRVDGPVTAPAPTIALTVNPATIQQGQSATLQWSSSNATSVSIDQGIGSVALNGSKTVSPTQTTTYTVMAQSLGGIRSASAIVTVTQTTFGPCDSKTTCGQMGSCAEAQYYLNVCKVTRLDGDSDGVPCESICPGG